MENEDEEKEYMIEDAEANSDNKEFMLQAIKDKSPWVIRYASDRLHDDKDLMMTAVKCDGQELYYASKRLRNDKELVMEAIKNKPLIVKYASKKLRGDKDIAKTVLLQNKDKFKIYLTDEILNDPEIKEIIEGDKKDEEN